MASINNLSNVAEEVLANATAAGGVVASDQTGVNEFFVGNIKVLTSGTDNIDVASNSADHAILSGLSNLDITGNENDNLIIGNDANNNISVGGGNDQVATGAGDDTIFLGAGDDVIEVDGGGIKTIDGGAGNDLFIIKAAADTGASTSTLTGLTIGDRVRFTVTDKNDDGRLGFEDVNLTTSDNGSVVFNLPDGSSFTLDGVALASATNGDINYEVFDNGDGSFDVVLSASS